MLRRAGAGSRSDLLRLFPAVSSKVIRGWTRWGAWKNASVHKRLSGNSSIFCAFCRISGLGLSDGRPRGLGAQVSPRLKHGTIHIPSGTVGLGPIQDPNEMREISTRCSGACEAVSAGFRDGCVRPRIAKGIGAFWRKKDLIDFFTAFTARSSRSQFPGNSTETSKKVPRPPSDRDPPRDSTDLGYINELRTDARSHNRPVNLLPERPEFQAAPRPSPVCS